MLIERLTLVKRADGHELSAVINGVRTWFLAPLDFPPAERVDPFLPGALLSAMALGEPLEVPPQTPVSTRLLSGMVRAQDILHAWNPELKKVEVRAAHAPVPPRNREVASFFSGGVDGLYTAYKHGAEIARLIMLGGFEMPLGNTVLWQQIHRSTKDFADETGRKVVFIQTNMWELAEAHRLDRHVFHGALLAGAGLTAGHAKTYVPSSWTYAHLVPWGSHVLLDPLWSTEGCEIVHDAAEVSRTEKITAIAQSPADLRVLRVCATGRAYNCGRCEKCLRTMVTLRLLGAKAPTLPTTMSLRAVRRAPVDDYATDLRANLELAHRVGDRAMARALRACLRRDTLKSLALGTDAIFLGGRLRRVYRWLRRTPREPVLIGCVPRALRE